MLLDQNNIFYLGTKIPKSFELKARKNTEKYFEEYLK